MFKKPKTKDVMSNVTTGVTLVGGGALGRGLASLIPADHKTVGRVGLSLTSFVGAAAVKNQTVQLLLAGLGAIQLLDLGTEQAKTLVKVKPDASAIENFGYAALGLKGCGCNGLGNPYLPGLMQPSVEAISWNTEFIPETTKEYADFEDLPLM